MDDFTLGGGASRRSLGGLLQTNNSLRYSINISQRSGSSDATSEAVEKRDQFISGGKGDFANASNAGVYPTLSRVKGALDVASKAAQTIVDLREEEVALAAAAAKSPQGEFTSNLNTELSTIETEIRRVQGAATYNGQNVLMDQTSYSLNVSTEGINDAVVIAPSTSGLYNGIYSDPASATSSRNPLLAISFATQAGAISAQSVLEENLSSMQGYADGVDVASNKADKIAREALVQKPTEIERPIPAIESAQALSAKIASQISSPYNNELQTQKLIESSSSNLNPDRVKDLLD